MADDQGVYVAFLIERLCAIAVDLNTVAARINTVAADLAAVYPPEPGE